MKKRKFLHIGLILVTGLLLAFFDLPGDTQKSIAPFIPQEILDSRINLGLDLQGGSQLDYKVDLRNVPELDRKSIMDGILAVINKRVNSLGVAEPNIYTSDVGDEKHLIVELAGIKDLEQAKEIVGKTIQLEFKEQKETPEDPNLEAEVKAKAQSLLTQALAGGDLRVLGQEEMQASPGKVGFAETTEFLYKDEIKNDISEPLFELEAGKTLDRVVDTLGNFTIDASGNIAPGPKGFHILKVTEKREQDRTIDTPRQVMTSHILVAFKGAQRADEAITRSEEEAKARAEEVMTKLNGGGDFTELAKEYSDDEGSKNDGGVLGEAVSADSAGFVKEYVDAAVALTQPGQLSQPVKSPFGFHIIKADTITDAKSETKKEAQIKYIDVYYSAAPDPWQATGLNGQHFVRADVEFTQTLQPYVSIKFNDEGAKLFEELTRKNVGKPIAIFVGGELISAPNVNETIAGGNASITGTFTIDEANALARDLNTGAIPAPIVLAGQYTIGATLGQDALSKSLYAGMIGFALVALFMILYYRLPGVLAVAGLCMYSAILLFLIKVALPVPWALGIAIAAFVYLILQILKNRESGPEKTISTILVCFILFFLTFILSTAIVMTLAGIAGVVLSIGMAVDANILIFERIKEELRDGRSLTAAIEVGFDRAWNSIRDSNFSSLITCGILFAFGTSIIQGFAFNLAAGILVSMFTAITITKKFLEVTANSALGKNLWLFGAPKKGERKLYPIVQKRKILYGVSCALLVFSIVGVPFAGFKLGLDFTGGTLMEFKFTKVPTVEELKSALVKSQDIVNAVPAQSEKETGTTQETGSVATEAATQPIPPSTSAETEIVSAQEKVDFTKAHIVPSDNSYIVKAQHINAAAHDVLIMELKKTLGEFEETRFTTVGPTVGDSLRSKAVLAVIIASVMIVLYIAFAFRRVPRYIGKWRFGLTAVVALVHDLIIMIGLYIYLGAIVGVEIDALFITALLTILGFSVHDTIVVFDRIREKLKFQKRDESFEDVANQAVNETFARSINTSFSVLLTLSALAILGSESIRYFVISLIIGIISGTYSSIFVATPLLVDWQALLKKKKGG